MKKILILFLIATSLGFSANYKVEVKPNVKIQKMELEQNNLEIEKRFTEMTKKEISNGIKEIDQQINSEKEAVRKSLKIAFASLHFAKVNRPWCYDCLCGSHLWQS